jgi:ABC-type phosphonate transport system ATPase subunit
MIDVRTGGRGDSTQAAVLPCVRSLLSDLAMSHMVIDICP